MSLKKKGLAVFLAALLLVPGGALAQIDRVFGNLLISDAEASTVFESSDSNQALPSTISRFERLDPVFTQVVEVGTAEEQLDLPDSLRVLAPLEEGSDPDSFVQTVPMASMEDGYPDYDFYHYGYVAPANAEDLYASGEPVVYFISYAARDTDGNALSTVGEVGYRVHGSIDGSASQWFATDANGMISEVVSDVPVSWESDEYLADTPGTYRLTAEVEGADYGEEAVAEITVEDPARNKVLDNSDATVDPDKEVSSLQRGSTGSIAAFGTTLLVAGECHCAEDGGAIDDDNLPWAHQEDCPLFSPIECMCREQLTETAYDEESGEYTTNAYDGNFTHEHDTNNKECPLYGRDTVRFVKLAAGEESVMGADDAFRITEAQKEGEIPYPALGEIEIIEGSEQASAVPRISPFSIGGGGANDVAQDNFMATHTATSGNPTVATGFGKGTPGSWVDYVNTIWMNKAFNKFAWTPAADTGAYNAWVWGGGTADQTSGTTQTNARRIPAPTSTGSSGVWRVYSGEQLRYAIANVSAGQTIELGGNLNLNGNNYAWSDGSNAQIVSGKDGVTLDGKGYSIYNAAATGQDDLYIFRSNSKSLQVKDLTLQSAKLISTFDTGNITIGKKVSPFNTFNGNTAGHSFKNVHIINSMCYTMGDAAIGFATVNPAGAVGTNEIDSCSVQGSFLRSRDHALGFAGGVARTTITNSFVTDTQINGYGGHSSGFIYCNHASREVQVSNCFASTEIYGAKYVVGFGAPFGSSSTIQNCFATGKIEGYEYLTGFAATQSSAQLNSYSEGTTYNNCYTTSLVGMRSEAAYVGGFISVFPEGDGNEELPALVKNSYAAGEVGDFTTDLDNPVDTGGFTFETNPLITVENSYYDKQTTAMREWVAGNTKTMNGVTGVLTTNTLDSLGGTVTGLADGTIGNKGFTGFTDNSKWVYTPEHYPQLSVFANPSSSFGAYADLVKAYSLASTSTVFLDTWNNGYDWTDDGVRTSDEISYARELASTGKTDHKGHECTYDTVREIISPFMVTSAAGFDRLVGSGAPSKKGDETVTDTVNINNATKKGTVNNPGMDWYRIEDSSPGATGFRPIRLIGYMAIEAGENKDITVGDIYNHRADVGLIMMNKLTNNLVIGMDDTKIWSESKEGGYPDTTRYYSAVTNNMETEFSASRDAWIYTEIWRAGQNPDGSYMQDTAGTYGYTDGTNNLVPYQSVRVTGAETGDNLTLDEQKWNGEFPFYPDFSHERKYIVSYYWMLSDGRYVSDYKIITIEPGKYDLKLDVLNYETGNLTDTVNSESLYIGTGEDVADDIGYTLSSATETHDETLDIPFTKNAAAGWKKRGDGISVRKTQVDLFDAQGGLRGTAIIDGDLKEGDELTFDALVYYISYIYDATQDRDREVTMIEELSVTYVVTQDTDGTFQLRFNKLANPPENEFESALSGNNDSTGIQEDAEAYVNDMMFNVQVTLWVSQGTDFEFIKTDKEGNHFGIDEAEFALYSCTKGDINPDDHSYLVTNDPDNCWGNPVHQSTDADGKITFASLATGDYMLVEVKTRPGYQLPTGQWLIVVNAVDGTYEISARGTDLPPAFKVTHEGSLTSLELPNYPNITMPHSGGMGALLFTIGGVALVGLAAIIFQATRKRRYPKHEH